MSLGYICDDADVVKRDLEERSSGRLLGSRIHQRPTAITHRHLVDQVQDQGDTGSCVGQAIASSIYLHGRFRGYPIDRPSAKGIYDIARLMKHPGDPVQDAGSSPGMAMLGIETYGIVAQYRWPLTNDNVNILPPLDVFIAGSSAKVTGWYRIPNGRSRVDDVESALEDGHFPVFGMPVDDAYMMWKSDDTWTGMVGDSRGGHMQCVIGYRPDALLVLNSWGESWGVGGCVWISKSVFTSATMDAYIITSAPSSVC